MTSNINHDSLTNNFSEQRQFLHKNPHEQFAASQLNVTQPANMVFSQLNSLLQNGLSVGTQQENQQTMRSPTLQSFPNLPGQSFPNLPGQSFPNLSGQSFPNLSGQSFPGDFLRNPESFQQSNNMGMLQGNNMGMNQGMLQGNNMGMNQGMLQGNNMGMNQGMGQLPTPIQSNNMGMLQGNNMGMLQSNNMGMGQDEQRFDSFIGTHTLSSNGGQGNVQPVRFGGELKAGKLPKLIAIAEAPNNGNIHLYEITKASILMVTNPQNMIINLQGLIRTDKSYDTPHGPKTGYIFYKNRPEHLNMIDQLFPGSDWKEQLVEAIPPPQEKKDPVLIWNDFLNYGNINHSTYLYEYSDKSLALFTTVELGDQLPKCKLQCPHLGKSEMGYSVWKNKVEHINFLKNVLKIPVDFESKYVKSVPKTTKVDKVEKEPIRIFYHPFEYNGVSYEIEVYEYTELSVAVFTTPMFPISGLTVTENLTHPTQGRRTGMIISKQNDAHMTILKNYINKHDLETLYVMEPKKSSRGDIMNSFGPVTSSNTSEENEQGKPRSYEDIPFDTLVRLLRVNLLKESDEACVKDLIGNEIMIIGEKTQVEDKLELYIDAKIKVELTIENKKLVIINLEE